MNLYHNIQHPIVFISFTIIIINVWFNFFDLLVPGNGWGWISFHWTYKCRVLSFYNLDIVHNPVLALVWTRQLGWHYNENSSLVYRTTHLPIILMDEGISSDSKNTSNKNPTKTDVQVNIYCQESV